MRRLLAVLFGLAIVLGRSAAARACSCDGPGPFLAPTDGQIGVPLDVQPALTTRFEGPVEVALLLSRTGEVVPTSIETLSDESTRIFFVTPNRDLEPRETYDIVFDHWGREQATFTTGAALDELAPEFEGLERVEIEAVAAPPACEAACAVSGASLDLWFDAPSTDAAVLLVELRASGPGELLATHFVPSWEEDGARYWRSEVRPHLCGWRSRSIDPGETYCVTLIARDLSGNRSGQGSTRCAVATPCAVDDTCAGCPNASVPPVPSNELPVAPSSGCRLASPRSQPAASCVLTLLAAASLRRRAKRS